MQHLNRLEKQMFHPEVSNSDNIVDTIVTVYPNHIDY